MRRKVILLVLSVLAVPAFGQRIGLDRYPVFELETTHIFKSDVKRDSGSLSMWEYDLYTSMAIEASDGWWLGTRPSYRLRTISDSTRLDLPSSLHQFSLPIFLQSPRGEEGWLENWSARVTLSPRFGTDLDNTGSDAWFLDGSVGLIYRYDQTLSLLIGVVYKDAINDLIIPAVGVDWEPSEQWRVFLMPPRPRIYYRPVETFRCWLGFEFTRDTYAVEIESTGRNDRLEIRDYRTILGAEWLFTSQASVSLEGGYLFGRELKYDRFGESRDLENAAMARLAFRIRI